MTDDGKKSAFVSFAGLQEDRECSAWPGFFDFLLLHLIVQTPSSCLLPNTI